MNKRLFFILLLIFISLQIDAGVKKFVKNYYSYGLCAGISALVTGLVVEKYCYISPVKLRILKLKPGFFIEFNNCTYLVDQDDSTIQVTEDSLLSFLKAFESESSDNDSTDN